EVLTELLPTFAAKDAFTLVLASRPNQPLLREVELDNVDEVTGIIRGIKPSETLATWEPIVRSVDELMSSGSYPIYEVTLVTDLRRAGWEQDLAELSSAWAEKHARLRVFDVGSAETTNVALVALNQL